MKERIYDLLKWTLILAIGGLIFYASYPRYSFLALESQLFRCDKISGEVEMMNWDYKTTEWELMGEKK